ncbi:hypothetical protein IQ07DRAFT_516625 [Pyrenochaeta sp. DS3sAY3a]|nr:hypothetical protein IQ07DRAFT_516625 [Pyrenochaeta sp. DS3sAY3a]
MWWWCSGDYISGSDARDLFWLMHSLPELRVLEVRMMSRSVDLFAAAFKARAAPPGLFVLAGVQELVVSNCAAFLAAHCPGLRRLVLREGDACAVEVYPPLAARLAPLHPGLRGAGGVNAALTHFEAAASWTESEVCFLVATFPGLTHVALRTESFCYRASLGTIVAILSGLRCLAVLRLAKIARLDMGYVRVWKRGIFEYKTEAARKALWVENERSRVEAENAVARMVFGEMGGLRECWVGEKRVARRLGEGAMEMGLRWVWERRRKEEVEEKGDLSELALYVQYKAERAAVVRRTEVCM